MSRSTLGYFCTLVFLLVGCDAAKAPMATAKEAEAAGKVAEAKTLYAEVCKASEKSPLCAAANERIEMLTVKEALALAAEGQYGKAKALGTSVTNANAKRAFDALGKTQAMTSGLAFEEASASADKAAARAKMEELAKESSAVAGKAQEWLDKNGPGLLLAEITAACKPLGTGSCAELGQTMAKRYGKSNEAAEAQKLVEVEEKRLYPLLKQAEGLLVQRLEIYKWKNKFDLCLKTAEPSPGGNESQVCKTEIGIPEDRGDPFSTSFLENAWSKKLVEIHDPGVLKNLQERWAKIESDGTYDTANIPKR